MAPAIAIALSLAQFAPSIMKWLGAGDKSVSVAESVADTAAVVAGVKSPEEAIAIFQKNGEKAWEFKTKMLEMEKDFEVMYLKDRENARNRDVEFIKAGVRNTRADLLAALAILSLIGCIGVLFFREIPAGPGRDVLILLIGTLAAIVKDVYSFEFGTSRSSKEKDAVISTLSSKKD